MHEELEIETIKASVFRHKILFFDSDLQREIDGRKFTKFKKNVNTFF